ncbi:MBL fold metallo-hydrolase [Georgenia sp. AZ-5]|uniref:MBL fold metallo-hydrolase n=1 Tax=Georgenia sp. AZ-5 TaxID=3367526 RepID=UPI0037548552
MAQNGTTSGLNPRVVTLGTAGGPMWWRGPAPRAGIATAVLVGDAAYLVDLGRGAWEQLMRAEVPLASVRAVFLTHLHSDHVVDLGSLAVFGLYELRAGQRIKILGPGDRGALPPVSPRAGRAPRPLCPEAPTPGTAATFAALMQAFATDLNDRIFDTLCPSPYEYFDPGDIQIPAGSGFHPNDAPTPDMEPFVVYADELVTVRATLVRHAPIAPAFAFRFDTAEGSVTISGDTAPCENLVRLARGTDLLLHEAIDTAWVHRDRPGVPEEAVRAAVDHHLGSHTSVQDCVRVATRAGARALALHHLVPGNSPRSVWEAGRAEFGGHYLVPADLDVIPFRAGSEAVRALRHADAGGPVPAR